LRGLSRFAGEARGAELARPFPRFLAELQAICKGSKDGGRARAGEMSTLGMAAYNRVRMRSLMPPPLWALHALQRIPPGRWRASQASLAARARPLRLRAA
ncbi:MAG: hypothetical protein M1336_05280, partial [Deltaproteobacteria bacterium]|nr:hypothetical protein [Deltaproteobacteria bacterium]